MLLYNIIYTYMYTCVYYYILLGVLFCFVCILLFVLRGDVGDDEGPVSLPEAPDLHYNIIWYSIQVYNATQQHTTT